MIKKAKGIGWKEFQGETILANFEKCDYFVLNETGGFIWKKIDGKNDEKKISESLAKECSVSQKKALADTKALIKKMVSLKLVKS